MVWKLPTLQFAFAMTIALVVAVRLDVSSALCCAWAAGAGMVWMVRPCAPALGVWVAAVAWAQVAWCNADAQLAPLGNAIWDRAVTVQVWDVRPSPRGCVAFGTMAWPDDLDGLGATVHLDQCLLPGDRVSGRAQVWQVHPGYGFDTVDRRWLASKRGGGLVVRVEAPSVVPAAGAWRLPRWVVQRRLDWIRDAQLHLAQPWLGVVIALGTGNKGWLDEDLAQVFADTGTSHVLAISGLHFGIVVAVVWGILGVCVRRIPWLLERFGAQRVQAAGLLVVLPFYLGFVGAPASAVRAWVMASVVATGHLTGRRPCGFHALAVAWVLGLCLDPLQLVELGFQLSFAAALGILVVVRFPPKWTLPPLLGIESRWSRMRRLAGAYVWTSWAANIATAPILLAHTGAVAWSSFMTNLVVVPVVSMLVFPSFTAASVAAELHPLGWAAVGGSVDGLVRLAPALESVAAWPRNMWVPGVPTWPAQLGYFVVACAILLPLTRTRRWVALVAGALAAWVGQREQADRVIFLDVGQGDATLIAVQGRTVLVDTGGSSHGPDVGRTRVLPQLRRAGVGRLDALVLTHPDLDHAGGARFLLRHVPIGQVLVNRSQRGFEPHGAQIVEGSRQLGERVLLHAPPPGSRNDESLFTEVRGGRVRVLLAGDAEAQAESWWVEKARGPFDVVNAPHHGSSTSSSLAYIRSVQPRLVVASAGVRNKFGHPSPSVRARWQHEGASVWATSEVGSVELRLDTGGLRTSRGP